MRVLLLAVVYTFALGISLAAAFYMGGGREGLQGPHVLRDSWPAIYALVALFAAVVAAPIRLALRDIDWRLVAVIAGAWFGEYLVLASGALADELNPGNAVLFWIAATGGPIQPVAAFLGALAGGWLVQRSRARV
jgi:hypothetical protein